MKCDAPCRFVTKREDTRLNQFIEKRVTAAKLSVKKQSPEALRVCRIFRDLSRRSLVVLAALSVTGCAVGPNFISTGG